MLIAKKEKSLSLNSLFYLFYNILNVIFPFVTGIYVSHILISADIGRIESARNLASYFVILSFLGIPTYGLREVAKVRNDKDALSKLHSELMIINTISTTIFSVIYGLLVFIVPEYRSDYLVYLLAGISIALNFLNNAWLFEGLEKFGFISIRNLIFKVISFACLIAFVRTKDDFLIYLIISVVGLAGNYIFNIFSAPRYVRLFFRGLDLKRHIKPILFLTLVNLAIEIYSMIDITMLTFMCKKSIVAYYSYGMKIFKILLQIVNTFTMVLVPRIALYYKENRKDEFNNVVSKTFLVICLVGLPMVVGVWFTSDYLIPTIYGDEYINSSTVLKILSLILMISPFGYLLGSRMLLVAGNEKKMILAVGFGAIVNVICNLFLIHFYNEIGAAVASVIGEITVMIIYVVLGRKYYKLINIRETIWKEIVAIVFMISYLLFISFLPLSLLTITILQVAGGVIIYATILLLLREQMSCGMIKKIINRVFKCKQASSN